MAIQSYFFNAVNSGGTYDRIYNAEDITSYLNELVGNGVFPNPSSQLQVRASTGMTVIVGTGCGWVNGHKMINTADMPITLDYANGLLDRIDEVVFYVDLTNRNMGIRVLKGTPASTPTPVVLTRNSTVYEMCLARIYVAKQTSAITDAMITDTRGNSDLCGFVQGLIQQVDTSTLWAGQQAQWNEWFSSVQDQFAAFKRFTKLEAVFTNNTDYLTGFQIRNYIPTYSSEYDIAEIYVSSLHRSSDDYTLTNGYVAFSEGSRPRVNAKIDIVVYHMTPDES